MHVGKNHVDVCFLSKNNKWQKAVIRRAKVKKPGPLIAAYNKQTLTADRNVAYSSANILNICECKCPRYSHVSDRETVFLWTSAELMQDRL